MVTVHMYDLVIHLAHTLHIFLVLSLSYFIEQSSGHNFPPFSSLHPLCCNSDLLCPHGPYVDKGP